ncbi:MAG TPA: transposase [Mycobacteriales bacterium]|nr:transposase [Mycobacteriales bacterium]
MPQGARHGRPPKWTRRGLIDEIRWRVRAGAPWRDMPAEYGCWQTVYGLFRRRQRDGTWAWVVGRLQARAGAAGLITWDVSVDSVIARAHQHVAGARKEDLQVELPGGVGRRSRPTTHWAAPVAGGPPRRTWPASRVRNRCPSSSLPGNAATARSSRPS